MTDTQEHVELDEALLDDDVVCFAPKCEHIAHWHIVCTKCRAELCPPVCTCCLDFVAERLMIEVMVAKLLGKTPVFECGKCGERGPIEDITEPIPL